MLVTFCESREFSEEIVGKMFLKLCFVGEPRNLTTYIIHQVFQCLASYQPQILGNSRFIVAQLLLVSYVGISMF